MLKKPGIIVFAGPNGSGKSTITKMANIIEPYINTAGGNDVPKDKIIWEKERIENLVGIKMK